MDSVLQLFTSPWSYAVLSVFVAVISVIGAYLYTRHQQKKLLAQINEQVKVQGKDNKEAVTENIKGPDAWPTEETEKVPSSDNPDVKDPIEFCGHIPSEVKKTQQRIAMKKLEEEMTEDQKAKEREVQRKQLEDIFKLMEQNNDKFGIKSFDDIQDQMTLYAQ